MNSLDPIAEAATLPFRIVESLRLPCGYERSFKLSPGAVLANRYLLGIDTQPIPRATIIEACRRMNMPEAYRHAFVEQLPLANLVFLGFEADAAGGAIHKVYLELWDHARKRRRDEPEATALLSHRGFKWDYNEPSRRVITDYRWMPGLGADEILSRIEDIYARTTGAIGDEAVRRIMAIARQRASAADYIFVEVSETGNERRSFDLNLYPAGLKVRDVRPAVDPLVERLDVPQARFERLMAIVPDKLFGHVSGGFGRDGKEYLTVYYEN